MMSVPDFSIEQSIEGKVCGLDEVGRGPLAGPVVAACCYIPEECYDLPFVYDIRDSKKLTKKALYYLFEEISIHFPHQIILIEPEEIDELNILQASLKAMEDATHSLSLDMDHALVDGNLCPANLPCESTAVVKGDSLSISIAAASILAKVIRDNLMKGLAEDYPHYGWERNVGYPTKEHIEAINTHGITPHHRKSFAPVRNFIKYGTTERQTTLIV